MLVAYGRLCAIYLLVCLSVTLRDVQFVCQSSIVSVAVCLFVGSTTCFMVFVVFRKISDPVYPCNQNRLLEVSLTFLVLESFEL